MAVGSGGGDGYPDSGSSASLRPVQPAPADVSDEFELVDDPLVEEDLQALAWYTAQDCGIPTIPTGTEVEIRYPNGARALYVFRDHGVYRDNRE